MSGHSKWSTIKRAKGVADAKRGQQFSKLSRAITVAAKQGGPDPDGNPRLKIAIEAARAANMPKDNIMRAIDKVSGGGADTLEEVTYEGYGPGGAALLVEAVTDNRNRTVAELRSIFNKLGGSMSEAGSVAWMFAPQAIIELPIDESLVEEASMAAIEAGAADLDADLEAQTLSIISPPDQAHQVAQALVGYGQPEVNTSLVASTTVPVDGEAAKKLLNLLEALDDHDDVQQVSTNAAWQNS
jgi:YebC/PmpR family DNA-binding regulatory protein